MSHQRQGIELLGRRKYAGMILWVVLASVGAGAFGGIAARYIAEFSMFFLLILGGMGLLVAPLALVGEFGVFLLCLVAGALIGGIIGMRLGEALRSLLCRPVKHLRNKKLYRYVLVTAPLWPILALWGFSRFHDTMVLGFAPILPSFMLWPLSGAVVEVTIAVRLLLQSKDA